MNKIKIAECINKELDKLIIEDNLITIKEDGKFLFEIKDTKDYNLNIKILKGVNALIEEINISNNININYTYNIEETTHLYYQHHKIYLLLTLK